MVLKADDIARLLATAGFEVYQTVDNRVDLAERVRDNLLMEANVSVLVGSDLRVRFATRAQRCDFPSSHETAEVLFERARTLGRRVGGFVEAGTEVVRLTDPSDADRVLDTWYMVLFDRVAGDLAELAGIVREAMAVEKVVAR
jgi:hypothetical protein